VVSRKDWRSVSPDDSAFAVDSARTPRQAMVTAADCRKTYQPGSSPAKRHGHRDQHHDAERHQA
jgi:hypothetical protein